MTFAQKTPVSFVWIVRGVCLFTTVFHFFTPSHTIIDFFYIFAHELTVQRKTTCLITLNTTMKFGGLAHYLNAVTAEHIIET